MKREKLKRLIGPAMSLALHVAIIYALLHMLGFTPKPEANRVEVMVVTPTELDLDEVLPLDPPQLENTADVPDALTPEQLEAIVPPDDTPALMQDDAAAILDNLSPLTITGIGADLSSQRALTTRYGERALRNGLLGSYFNRVDFTGETHMRIDETLNYVWETASPWPGRIRDDRFSVIWTGRLVPPRTGEYTFYLMSDDGARLWIDGELVLDQFVERERETDEVKRHLLVGKSYDIKYAFCEVFVHAVSRLEWSCEECGIPRQLIPPEHMWADGPSSRQLMAWNKMSEPGAGALFPNRSRMRNPAMIEGQPFSHIVGYKTLTPEALARLGLEDLTDDLNRFLKTGNMPSWARLPAVPPDLDTREAAPARPRAADVIITVQ